MRLSLFLFLLAMVTSAFAYDPLDAQLDNQVRSNRQVERQVLENAELYGTYQDRVNARRFVEQEERINQDIQIEKTMYDEIKILNGNYR
jgi:hypothetical protein